MISWGLISCLITLACFAVLIIIYPLGKTLKKGFTLFVISLLLVMALAYYQWGSFLSWQQYKQNELAEQRAKALLEKIKSPEELITKLKTHLDDTPSSARGWYLLGRLYVSQGAWEPARDAFAKAHQLNLNDEGITINYAYSLWRLNGQQFNNDIRSLFDQLLKQNPSQPDALAMLAVDAYDNKYYAKAVDYWQRLLKLAPPDSEEARALRKAIAKALAAQQA
ncbi:tetratricopeptide repeat protein [Legionella sp. D16C41]|uniref:tetratricopeptide repeat protein n=1 Tax=Legionella sp. D16C41 TaxID=3402688 RepID=UPI003AF6D206